MSGFANVVNVDSVITELLFVSSAKNGPAGAERELILAVLSDAIECYWKYQKSDTASAIRLYQDAKKWIFADNDSQPFSFVDVCEMLQLDPSFIRRGITAGAPARATLQNFNESGELSGRRRNIKRNLKDGRSRKGARLFRPRVRLLRVDPGT